MRKDSDFDDVALARGVKKFMIWGKPFNKQTLRNQGGTCGYCQRYFDGYIRRQNISMTAYKQTLTDDDRRRKHMKCVDGVVQRIIEKGGNSSGHLNFQEITDDAEAFIEHEKSIDIERPGFSYVEKAWYDKQHWGDKTGHELVEFDGKQQVKIPDAPVTRVKMHEKLAAVHRK
eukprot:4128868-Pyramimonas_sp.AAC.1